VKTTTNDAYSIIKTNMQEPFEYVGPSDDRPPKKKSRNIITSKQQIQCICSWDDCDNIYDALKKRLPDDDPWAGNPIQFHKRRASLKYRCLKQSIFHHFGIKGGECSQILQQSLFVVRRHHWPRELLRLSEKGSMANLVFRHSLKTINHTEGYNRLIEDCNKYHVILTKLGEKLKPIADPRRKGDVLSIREIKKGVFVRAPVVDHSTAYSVAMGTRRPINKKNVFLPPSVEQPSNLFSPNAFPEDDLLPKDKPPSEFLPHDDVPEDDILPQEDSSDSLQDNDFEYNQMVIEQPSATIIPSVDKLRKTLVTGFSTVYSQGWCLDQIGRDALWLLQNRYTNFEPIAIAPRLYLYPCDYRNGVSKSNCLVYSLRIIDMKKSIPCDACKEEKNGNKKRLYRR
jgi:hypothetical protein